MYVFGGTVDNNIRSGEMYRFQLAAFPKCTLQEDLGRLLTSKQFTDIRFLVGPAETAIEAHVALVVARSNFLLSLVREARETRSRTTETSSVTPVTSSSSSDHLEVKLPDANPKAFDLVLDFIYTDQIDPTRGHRDLSASNEVVLIMMQVFTLALRLQMRRLDQLTLLYIENSINLLNVLVALKNASSLGLAFVKEFCLKFIIKESNYNQIIMSKEFETLEQELMVEIIRRKQSPGFGAKIQIASPPPKEQQPPDHAPHPRGEGDGTTLQEDLRKFLASEARSREFSDVTLVLGTERLPGHKAVLAARSSYFEGMFRSFRPPTDSVNISIGEMVPSGQSFQSLLR